MQVTGANQNKKKIAIYWYGKITLMMEIDVSKTSLPNSDIVSCFSNV